MKTAMVQWLDSDSSMKKVMAMARGEAGGSVSKFFPTF